MQLSESSEFVHLHSPFLAMAAAKRFPMVSQFGIESGGRLKRHIEQNLLRSGKGFTALHQGQSSFRQSATLQHSPEKLQYDAQGNGLDWQILFPNDRTFILRLTSRSGPIKGEFFRMAFSPETSPVTVWGQWLTDKPFPPKRSSSIFDVPDVTVDFRVPVLVHFPDYGLLKATCANPAVFARQTMSADPAMTGLSLGCHNTAYHTSRYAYHCGTVELSFHSTSDLNEIEIVFSVEPEHCPQIDGIDFSGPQWAGLRRSWQNAFTLNPETLSMGDNPVLHGIAHLAIHFKSDMSVFTPPLLDGFTVHDVLRRQLEITLRDCVGESGEINARYATPEGRARKTGDFGFFDANISNLIALYNYTAATGDWSLARTYSDQIRRAGRFLLALDRDDDGILELPFDGNAFRQDRECRNWWDNFSFGHKDAFVNLLAYRALGNLAEILDKLDFTEDSQHLARWRRKFAANFHKVFYNPATGVYAGWVSADGRMHDYLFTFISAMAINEGLVPPQLAQKVLQILLAKLRAEGYGDWKWGIPGPLISVAESDGFIWEPMQRWGSYENGGFCGQPAYHFIQALYTAGLRDDADKILFTMIETFEKEFTHSGVFPGYMRSVDWRTREGMPCGYNYLADNYYFLLAAITGHFSRPMPGLPPVKH